MISYFENVSQINDRRILTRHNVEPSSEGVVPPDCFHPENWDEMVLAYSKKRLKK